MLCCTSDTNIAAENPRDENFTNNDQMWNSQLPKIVEKPRKTSKIWGEWDSHLQIFSLCRAIEISRQYTLLLPCWEKKQQRNIFFIIVENDSLFTTCSGQFSWQTLIRWMPISSWTAEHFPSVACWLVTWLKGRLPHRKSYQNFCKEILKFLQGHRHLWSFEKSSITLEKLSVPYGPLII